MTNFTPLLTMPAPEPITYCLLCEQDIDFSQPYFSTYNVFLPPDDPLYRFCGMPLHWDCVAHWEHSSEFLDAYFRGWIHELEHNPNWHLLQLTDDYLLKTKPNPPEMAVEILLRETGSRIQVPIAEWTNWLKDTDAAIAQRHPLEQAALIKVLPEIRVAYKNEARIYKQINWW